MDDVGVVDVRGVLDEGVDEVLRLGAAGADEDVVAGLDELHRRGGGGDFALYFSFQSKSAISNFPALSFFHADSGVDGDGSRAVRADHKGVDVHFLNLGEFGNKLREPLQTFGDGVDIDALLAAGADEHFIGSGADKHLFGLVGGERRQVERDVLHNLDHSAAHTEHHQRAEVRVAVHTEDDLFAAGAHFLNEDAEDFGVAGAFWGCGTS